MNKILFILNYDYMHRDGHLYKSMLKKIDSIFYIFHVFYFVENGALLDLYETIGDIN